MAVKNPTPVWRNNRWIIQVQKNGVRHSFSSSIEGRNGKNECLNKYYAWLDGGVDGKKTLDKVFNEYLDDIKNRKGEDTPALYYYRKMYDSYFPEKLKSKKMCNITLKEWQDVLNNAKKKNGEYLSKKTLKGLRILINTVIRFGYEDYQCELPRKRLYIPENRAESKEREILTFEQMNRLFEPSDRFYHNAIKFMALYGLRPSEVLGIKESDIKNNILTIQRGITQRGTISKGKTVNAHRKIYLGELGLQIIEDTIKRNKELKLNSEYIFCSRKGGVGIRISLARDYQVLREERDLGDTSLYSLRHTFITYFKSRIDLESLKDTVGHSKSFATTDVYGNHFLQENAKKTSAVIDDTFKNIIKCNKSASNNG